MLCAIYLMDETLQREYGMFDRAPELEVEEMPRMPHFPIIIFSFAVLKDGVIDPILFGIQLTPVAPLGWVLSWFSSIIFGLAIFLWFLGKPKIQKADMPWLVKRIMLATAVGFIPGASFVVPETSLLVFLTHKKEKENVRLFLERQKKIEDT